MPLPNEHAARQREPEGFTRFRRGSIDGWPEGLAAIFGVRADGTTAIQSIRAEARRWTEARFREWLKGHGFKTTIETATEKAAPPADWSGLL